MFLPNYKDCFSWMIRSGIVACINSIFLFVLNQPWPFVLLSATKIMNALVVQLVRLVHATITTFVIAIIKIIMALTAAVALTMANVIAMTVKTTMDMAIMVIPTVIMVCVIASNQVRMLYYK